MVNPFQIQSEQAILDINKLKPMNNQNMIGEVFDLYDSGASKKELFRFIDTYTIKDEFKLSDTLRQLGIDLHISSLGVSKRTGLSVSIIEKLMFMEINMNKDYAERFSKAFGNTEEYWLSLNGESHDANRARNRHID